MPLELLSLILRREKPNRLSETSGISRGSTVKQKVPQRFRILTNMFFFVPLETETKLECGKERKSFFSPMIKLLMTDTAFRVKNPRCLYQVWWNAGNQVGAVQRWRGWRSLFPFISLAISFHCWYTAGSANLSHKDRLGTIGWILIPDGASVWCEGLFSLRYAFLWEKKKSNKIVCTSWHLVKFSFFFFFNTKSSIALTLSWLITTSLINFESVTLEFHHAKYLLQQEKTLFKTTFFFSFQMYELI